MSAFHQILQVMGGAMNHARGREGRRGDPQALDLDCLRLVLSVPSRWNPAAHTASEQIRQRFTNYFGELLWPQLLSENMGLWFVTPYQETQSQNFSGKKQYWLAVCRTGEFPILGRHDDTPCCSGALRGSLMYGLLNATPWQHLCTSISWRKMK